MVTYNDTTVTPSNTYYYHVKAYNTGGDSNYSPEASAMPASAPPDAPSAITATTISYNRINLSWSNVADESRYKIERKFGAGGFYAQIATTAANVIAYNDVAVTASNTYYYQVRAFNAAGDSGYSPEANATTPETPPDAPITLTAIAISSTRIDLSWSNVSRENGYKIERKLGTNDTYIMIDSTATDEVTYSDTVTTGIYYYYRVSAYNDGGDGNYSPEASMVTGGKWSTVAAGTYITLACKTNGTLWAWGDAYPEPAYGNIPNQIGNDSDWSIVTTALGNNNFFACKTNGSLWSWGDNQGGQLGQGYVGGFLSIPTQVGTSSDWLAVSPPGTNLSKIASGILHTLAIKTNGTIWSCGADMGGGFLGLGNLYPFGIGIFTQIGTDSDWSMAGAGDVHSIALKANGTIWAWGGIPFVSAPAPQLGLGAGNFRINIPTQIGTTSDWSIIAAGSYHTLAIKSNQTLWAWGRNESGQLGVGDTINRNTPTQIGPDSDWSMVSAGNSHSIALKTNGTIWMCSGGIGQVGTDSDWFVVSAGISYTIALKTNRTLWAWGQNWYGQLGLGDMADRSLPTLVEEINPPDAPGALTATTISPTHINLVWPDVSSEDGYKIERKLGIGGTYSQIAMTNANTVIYDDTTVIPNNTYYYRVRAFNTVGEGYSPEANATTPQAPPSAPDSLSASAVSGTQINLYWQNVTNETGYKIERKIGAGGTYEQITTPTADTTFYADTTVTPSNTYYYQVRAFNTAGDSPYGSVADATTPSNPPSAPSALTATALSSSQINLSWTDIANETCYKIERKTGVGGTYSQINTVGPATGGIVSYSDNTLSPLITYYYQIRAYNTGGNSNYSPEVYDTTLSAGTPPDAPEFLSATALSSSQIALTWTNVANETGYYVERGPDAGGPWTRIITPTFDTINYNDTGLTGGTTYYYQVCAYNDSGSSNYVAANAITIPNAPSSLTATPFSSSQINLSWIDVTGETSYTLDRSTNGVNYALLSTLNANTTTYSDTGLSGSKIYYYRVRATNGSGDSGYATVNTMTLGNWSILIGGGLYTIALKFNQTLWAWGKNDLGQLGDGTLTNRITPRLIGTVSDWLIITGTNLSVVAAGSNHTIARKTNNTIWTWGWNVVGQLGLGEAFNKAIPTQVNTQTDWSTSTAGYVHSLGLKNAGTLWAWGFNAQGQLGLGDTICRYTPTQVTTETNWLTISAGLLHSLGLKSTGTLWAWGDNQCGQLGLGDTISRTMPTQINTQTDWSNIRASWHSIGLKTNGTIWAWGKNDVGQLGLGDTNIRYTPTQIGTVSDWFAITVGLSHTLAQKSNGTIWSWGDNSSCQLGLGDTNGRKTPVQIGTDSDWSTIRAGYYHTLCLKTTSTLWAWGKNDVGQLGLGDTFNRNTPTLIGE